MKRMIVLICIALILIVTDIIFSKHYIDKKPEKPMLLLDSIYYQILALEIEHPKIVYSQALLESGYATSPLFVNNHNLFGMKESGQRATTSNVIINEYKYYPNWRESIIDYALLQMAFYKGLTRDEYYNKLRQTYANDSLYIHKIKRIEENLKY